MPNIGQGPAKGKGRGYVRPPFTKENAAEMARRGAEVRRANRAAKLEMLAEKKADLGLPPEQRPLNKAEIEALAKEFAPVAVHTLVEIASDPEDSRAVAASEALLSRAYGKPKQAVDVAGAEGGPLNISVEFVKAIKPDHEG